MMPLAEPKDMHYMPARLFRPQALEAFLASMRAYIMIIIVTLLPAAPYVSLLYRR